MKSFITSVFILFTVLLTAQDWEKYKSVDLAFITEFPGKPQRTTQQIETAVGELDMHMVGYGSSQVGDNIYYAVVRSDYPKEQFSDMSDEKIKSILDGAVNGAVNNVQGTLESDEDITLNGYPGRKIKIDAPGMEIFMNAYLVENVMYINQVIAEEDKVNSDNLKKFFSAFDIINVKQ
ncbi:hypothetical protein [Winogradskyella sp.]